jgi:hypothetical protein
VADATGMLGAVAGRETEVVGQTMADVVAVDQVCGPAVGQQVTLERDRDRRLA